MVPYLGFRVQGLVVTKQLGKCYHIPVLGNMLTLSFRAGAGNVFLHMQAGPSVDKLGSYTLEGTSADMASGQHFSPGTKAHDPKSFLTHGPRSEPQILNPKRSTALQITAPTLASAQSSSSFPCLASKAAMTSERGTVGIPRVNAQLLLFLMPRKMRGPQFLANPPRIKRRSPPKGVGLRNDNVTLPGLLSMSAADGQGTTTASRRQARAVD